MNQIFNDKVDVIRPPITYPKAAVQWARGTKQVVRWDTKDIPPQRNSTTGLILLGRVMNDSENLDIDHPLASRFSISSGQQTVMVPDNITCGDNYIVVLFGDSGNRSPEFQIL
ncbi:hypothetical protein CPB83DRAFT_820882 [Crepidotus variabilis]|uniref:Uncharacterized protein n=1 Tax=Crepidotus variabilis TaxID=179855 RepID=A0A9P6JK49_9AGAR|nr:hypothetical protein CPB83DRAFT_820882 [Crepidotus variabilis]